jgi:hypothetical protein
MSRTPNLLGMALAERLQNLTPHEAAMIRMVVHDSIVFDREGMAGNECKVTRCMCHVREP